MSKNNLSLCKIVKIPTAQDKHGNATFLTIGKEVPFNLKRVYYLYNVPKGKVRGAHAHKKERQIIVAISGSFEVHLDDGHKKRKILLNDPKKALYIPPMIWREFHKFSKDGVLLALVDGLLDQKEYIKDYAEFKRAMK
jgi:dTDP-4-dehydrorhamnose 3,5-epimerase-like enzyme